VRGVEHDLRSQRARQDLPAARERGGRVHMHAAPTALPEIEITHGRRQLSKDPEDVNMYEGLQN
jgi:hypothetical protein